MRYATRLLAAQGPVVFDVIGLHHAYIMQAKISQKVLSVADTCMW